MTSLHISNCTIQGQPANSITISNGRISDIGGTAPQGVENYDAQGALLLPGLVDLYCLASDIGQAAKAAAQGGITTLCTSPDSKPLAETSADIKSIQAAAVKAAAANVLPLGILTSELKGEQLANMHGLVEAGCIALSNARRPVKNALVMRRLMEYAATHDITIFLTPQDQALAANGLMHEGPQATRLGLAGIPQAAETIALAQQIILAELTGAKVHISQISCAQSVEMISAAQQKGIRISADVAIANLLYTDQAINGYNTSYYVQPPLRSEADRQGLLQGVAQGILAISSNHAGRQLADKKATFADAEQGMSTLDTFLPMLMSLQQQGLTKEQLIAASQQLPAQILGLDSAIRVGAAADLVLFDPEAEMRWQQQDYLASASNSPVIEQTLNGQVVLTLCGGQPAYQRTA